MQPDVASDLNDPENKKDCEKKKANIDMTNIFNTEDVYDMKKVKKDVGIPSYPKLKSGEGPLPTPATSKNPSPDPTKLKGRIESEIEELDDDY